MKKEEILYPARALTQSQREHYFEKGYVAVEGLVQDVLSELLAVTESFVDAAEQRQYQEVSLILAQTILQKHPFCAVLKCLTISIKYIGVLRPKRWLMWLQI